MKFLCVAFLAALMTVGAEAVAQDVTLTSRDGDVEISGNLLGYDGEFYRVDTIYGELTVDGSGVLCDGPGCPNLEDFVAEARFSGAPTVGRVLMPALIEAFALRNGMELRRDAAGDDRLIYVLSDRETGQTRGRFIFRLTNSDEGFADLLANEADIVMSIREVREDEMRRAQDAGLGDLSDGRRSLVLALDALVPIVAADNPVVGISIRNLVKVLTGKIDNWSGLGGVDAPIDLHLHDPQSGLGQVMQKHLLRGEDTAQAELHADPAELGRSVAKNPFAIGVTSRSISGLARALALEGACGFSVRATRWSIKTEDYPLTAPVFLYLPARRFPKLVREFLAFSRNRSAQLVIRRAGYVDQQPEEIAISAQGERFANAILRAGDEVTLKDLKTMVQTLAPLQRLTTTFRFEPGSARPDAQSRANIGRLARALETGEYDERRLVFAGFSDGEGPAQANRRIARRRADTVRKAVIDATETADLSRVDLETAGFGEAMPMACDDSDWGRSANRRVEIWVR
ncbi:cell envelope biogenesis protein OmpA [Roseovarius sp. TE539]|uniref:substrate-binding domain-containing protein n=1 Tax=Roseovarius sp. TE539 TaxID=2249812 RepID=UPI000DE12FCE|nr:substrate-binding domain-containing protein [Roseovarius sp. TE539]RBI77578.1 cell envelope biogenesis protein OmpA [Roseovarius sp. TE539]